MFSDLVEIAWGPQAGFLNQGFSILLITITFIQLGRFLLFWDRLNQWARAFVEAKLAFDNENAVKLKSKMDELQPPHSASDQLWILLPPVLIMLGLIGTFIGLTLALGQIPFDGDAAKIQEGVKRALPSMGSAFWTSLSAICSALVIRLTTMMMESMFKRRVLRSIVSADPQLIQYIERRAFQENKPGALLRPHSLREVLWQQNIEFTRQLERLGSEISSAIRELPYAMAPMHDEVGHVEASTGEREPVHAESQIIEAQRPQLTHEPQVAGAVRGEPEMKALSQETHDHALLDRSTQSMSYQEIHGVDPVSIELMLHEMRRQTLLLEQILMVQKQQRTAHRIARSTQETQSIPFPLDDPFDS